MKKFLFLTLAFALAVSLTACSSSDYKKADGYLAEGKYDAAIEMFEDLGDYKDSADRVLEAKYQKADSLLGEQEYEDAYAAFEEVQDYSDAQERMKEVRYAQAEAFVAEEKLEDALAVFQELGDYSDATERVAEVEEMMKIHATAVTLNKTSLSLSKGKTETLTATMEPIDTTDVIESWASSDESIATVDANGTVTAVAVGSAKITVTTSNALTAECEVTVPKPATASTGGGATSNASAADKAKAKAAYASLKASCKFPDTLKIYNVWAFDLNSYTKIEIEYSAENNYGQSVRKFFNATFEGNSLTLTKTTDSNPINSSGFLGSNVRNLGTGSVY